MRLVCNAAHIVLAPGIRPTLRAWQPFLVKVVVLVKLSHEYARPLQVAGVTHIGRTAFGELLVDALHSLGER